MRPQSRLSRLSIEYKVPLISGALLLIAVVALVTAAYVEVRASAKRTAVERLTAVTVQFRDLFQQSAVQLRALTSRVAANPALADYARTRDPKLRERALAALGDTGARGQQVVSAGLWDSSGKLLVSTNAQQYGLDTAYTGDVLPSTEPGDSAVVGAFRTVRDTTIYPIAVPVPGVQNVYLVHWRRVGTSRRTRQQITGLVGSDASVFLGTAGGAWTNLERPVGQPPVDLTAARQTQTYRRGADSTRYLSSASLIPGTPWVVAVDFPVRQIMAPVDKFARLMTLIALLALALGLFGAWRMSRRITWPLRELTQAADSIAVGDFSKRPRITRSDELGRLGEAFSTMADEVQQSRSTLEHRVVERTRDLNDTLAQLHEAQDTLVRREKLALLGQLSSGVGHELRNPLGVMTNAVYYLKTVLASAPQNVHEYLDILQQQITLSEKIVSDLLDFARSKPPQRRPTSVAEITHAQIGRLGSTNGIRIDTTLPPDLPPVLVDQVQLGQIVLNLLTNAIQAIQGTGAVSIRASATGDSRQVQYEVHDTGAGIPPENLEKVFEPLFTTKARGIGLGLAVSRTLARANNGDLTVTSAPGAGSTFRLTLETADGGRRA